MPHILHVSTECYPAAKAGGMGDVVGALPKFLIKGGMPASVIIPKYKTAWLEKQKFQKIQKGSFKMAEETIYYTIEKVDNSKLGFPLYVIDIPGKFDRESIYLNEEGHGFADEKERYMSFQIATLEWLLSQPQQFDIVHCHDHMTAMIIFLMKYGNRYRAALQDKPTFFTIHNGQYRGEWDWYFRKLIPEFDNEHAGVLDWDSRINNLALAIKMAWKISTVSPSYMQELIEDSDTLTPLYQSEKDRTAGILNGIDPEDWNPTTDENLKIKLTDGKWSAFKSKNKSQLLKQVALKSKMPVISYIGRLAHQKGVDILLQGIEKVLENKVPVRFVILGTGDKDLEEGIINLAAKYPENIAPIIAYDEKTSRLIYAGSDFMIMPSRFEPCGLNQMYCMRYGTIPIVRSIGGLKDTVPDIDDGGNGIAFDELTPQAIEAAIVKAANLYKNKKEKKKLQDKITQLDFSWNNSAQQYIQHYKEILNYE